ncbi:uncharacterized protein LOC126906933 [Daktulosphaira vitifoliae]|uniref:uncharacterized protein LOC126906933 n=1 Tax=Daktulosphaira vitifoliae TaxID=58002 RepID=UPI0021A99CEC|nr:uncharacterized protein LOC126906933 [Daktulosphaira vitifoliae]
MVYKRNYKRCSVPFCNSNNIDFKRISFFKFPKDEKLRNIWMKNCGVDFQPEAFLSYFKCPKICEEHFEKTMYRRLNNFCSLHHDAVPTLFNDETLKHKELKDNQVNTEFPNQNINSNPLNSFFHDKVRKSILSNLCSVPFCINISRRIENGKPLKFYTFPKDDNLRGVWIKNCGLEYFYEELNARKRLKVCEKHFETKMFKKQSILPTAVPTLFSDLSINYINHKESEVFLKSTIKPQSHCLNISSAHETCLNYGEQNKDQSNSFCLPSPYIDEHFSESKPDLFNSSVTKTETNRTMDLINSESVSFTNFDCGGQTPECSSHTSLNQQNLNLKQQYVKTNFEKLNETTVHLVDDYNCRLQPNFCNTLEFEIEKNDSIKFTDSFKYKCIDDSAKNSFVSSNMYSITNMPNNSLSSSPQLMLNDMKKYLSIDKEDKLNSNGSSINQVRKIKKSIARLQQFVNKKESSRNFLLMSKKYLPPDLFDDVLDHVLKQRKIFGKF